MRPQCTTLAVHTVAYMRRALEKGARLANVRAPSALFLHLLVMPSSRIVAPFACAPQDQVLFWSLARVRQGDARAAGAGAVLLHLLGLPSVRLRLAVAGVRAILGSGEEGKGKGRLVEAYLQGLWESWGGPHSIPQAKEATATATATGTGTATALTVAAERVVQVLEQVLLADMGTGSPLSPSSHSQIHSNPVRPLSKTGPGDPAPRRLFGAATPRPAVSTKGTGTPAKGLNSRGGTVRSGSPAHPDASTSGSANLRGATSSPGGLPGWGLGFLRQRVQHTSPGTGAGSVALSSSSNPGGNQGPSPLGIHRGDARGGTGQGGADRRRAALGLALGYTAGMAGDIPEVGVVDAQCEEAIGAAWRDRLAQQGWAARLCLAPALARAIGAPPPMGYAEHLASSNDWVSAGEVHQGVCVAQVRGVCGVPCICHHCQRLG